MNEGRKRVQELWDSGSEFVEPGLVNAWLTTSEDRWQEIQQEIVNCIPAHQAIAMVKASLAKATK